MRYIIETDPDKMNSATSPTQFESEIAILLDRIANSPSKFEPDTDSLPHTTLYPPLNLSPRPLFQAPKQNPKQSEWARQRRPNILYEVTKLRAKPRRIALIPYP